MWYEHLYCRKSVIIHCHYVYLTRQFIWIPVRSLFCCCYWCLLLTFHTSYTNFTACSRGDTFRILYYKRAILYDRVTTKQNRLAHSFILNNPFPGSFCAIMKPTSRRRFIIWFSAFSWSLLLSKLVLTSVTRAGTTTYQYHDRQEHAFCCKYDECSIRLQQYCQW